MLRYIVVSLAMVVSGGRVFSQTPSTTVTFEERVHDFGNILEKNGKATHVFIFHNNGKTPVVLNDIYSGCGCIGRVLSKDPVKPGGKGKVTITFDPEYKSGFFSKEITVFSKDGQEYNRIWVQGTITPYEHPVQEDYPYNFGEGLYLRLKVMSFGYMKPGETQQAELHYANSTNKEMILNFVAEAGKGNLKFTNPGKIGPKAKGVVNFTYTMPSPGTDDVILHVTPYVNNKKLTGTLDIKALNANKPRPKKVSNH
jgi:hypothetical protein